MASKTKPSEEKGQEENYGPSELPFGLSIDSFLPKLDSAFMLKAPFLAILFLLFTFALFLLAESQVLSPEWLSELSRYEVYLLPRLFSIVFVLFIVLISLSFALAAFFGYGQNSRANSVFVLAATIIPALVAGFVYGESHPNFVIAFLGLAIGVSATAFFASGKNTPGIAASWDAVGSGLTVLSFLGAAAMLGIGYSDADFYLGKMIDGILDLMPQIATGLAATGATLVEGYQFDNESIESFVGESETQAVYGGIRDILLASYSGQVRTVIESSLPKYEGLTDSAKNDMELLDKREAVKGIPTLKQKVATSLRDYSKQTPDDLKASFSKTRQAVVASKEAQALKNLVPFLLALQVFFFISLAKWPVRAIAALAAGGLAKL